MCGRFTLQEPKLITKRFGVSGKLPLFEPTFNAAPSQSIPIVVKRFPKRVVLMKWGFIPEWGKEKGINLINIRSESVKEKPYFRKVLMKRRCIVPCSGFYEWRQAKDEKIPYYIYLKDKAMFGFAGLYSSLSDAEGKTIDTFAILTCPPNSFMKKLHNRMPVILNKKDESSWLDNESKGDYLLKLLKPYSSNLMKTHSVSKLVNNTRNNSKELIKHKDKYVVVDNNTVGV
ncbi:SOS response-associated peptidase [Patescibacteria group bacterium]